MTDITATLNDILMDRCLVSAGTIDTFTSEAIEISCTFLSDCGVPYIYETTYPDNIVAFSWIEYDKPHLMLFRIR